MILIFFIYQSFFFQTSMFKLKLKNVLKGRDFVTLENIQKSVTNMLKAIPIEDFQRCYQKWEQRLHQCVAARGNYFEGDNIDV